VTFSLVYLMTRRLLAFIVLLRRGDAAKVTGLLAPRHENAVLRRNLPGCGSSGEGVEGVAQAWYPEHPTPLAEGIGDFTVNGQGKKAANKIHSVFAWDAGDNAYAVIVDNEEGTDVDIIDITNPKKPFLTAEYDLDQLFPQILQAAPSNLVEVLLHDMVVKEIDGRQVMLASYWDAGYVKVDFTNVHNPVYLGDTDFTDPDPEAADSGYTVPPEGNGHEAEFTPDNRYVIGADEDFGPYALLASNLDDGTDIDASQGSGTTQLVEGQTITARRSSSGGPATATPRCRPVTAPRSPWSNAACASSPRRSPTSSTPGATRPCSSSTAMARTRATRPRDERRG